MAPPVACCSDRRARGFVRQQCDPAVASIAHCLPECPERRWLLDATWRVIREGISLDEALGITGPGWTNPRQVLLHARRDDLLRQLYDRCYRGVSLRGAAEIIAADHARLLASWGRMRPRLDLISHTPATARGFHELLAAEGHAMPGPSQLRLILRRAVIRPVADLDSMETDQRPDAASRDAA